MPADCFILAVAYRVAHFGVPHRDALTLAVSIVGPLVPASSTPAEIVREMQDAALKVTPDPAGFVGTLDTQPGAEAVLVIDLAAVAQTLATRIEMLPFPSPVSGAAAGLRAAKAATGATVRRIEYGGQPAPLPTTHTTHTEGHTSP